MPYKNPENARLWYASLPPEKKEAYLAHRREYRKAHPLTEERKESLRQYRRAWAARNRDRLNAQENERNRRKRESITDKDVVDAFYTIARGADELTCPLCGRVTKKWDRHVDHIVPISRGGRHTGSNLQIVCARCNLAKGDNEHFGGDRDRLREER
jgi:5-methylcytosine-specific restriction endonuclease McrA